jgi:phytoene dehydrogenase-like protein
MTEDTVDVVVAGAGHNGLIAAAYLAKAGLRVLVVEARGTVGGDTSTEELVLPGFLHDTCSTAHNLLQSSPLMRDDELHLSRYGLEYLRPDPVVHMPFPDGSSITHPGASVSGGPGRNATLVVLKDLGIDLEAAIHG